MPRFKRIDCPKHGTAYGYCPECTFPPDGTAVPAQSAPTPEPDKPSVPDIICMYCGARYIRFIDGKWQAWTVDKYDPICYANLDRAHHEPIPPTSAPGSEGGQVSDDEVNPHYQALSDAYMEQRREIADLKRQLAEAERKGWNEGTEACGKEAFERGIGFNKESWERIEAQSPDARALAKESK